MQAVVEDSDHASSSDDTPIPSLSVEDGVESVTRYIQEFVESCQLEEVRGRELRYILPLHQAKPSVLARLFRQLDIDKERLGITSYGLTACSMEEVCLCVSGGGGGNGGFCPFFFLCEDFFSFNINHFRIEWNNFWKQKKDEDKSSVSPPPPPKQKNKPPPWSKPLINTR